MQDVCWEEPTGWGTACCSKAVSAGPGILRKEERFRAGS